MTLRVYLDTNVFIAAFERVGPRSDGMWCVLAAIEAKNLEGITSELTLAELLPRPLVDGQVAFLSKRPISGLRIGL